MELSDKKLTRITIVSSGLEAEQSVGLWHQAFHQKNHEEVILSHYDLSTLSENFDQLEQEDLVIVVVSSESKPLSTSFGRYVSKRKIQTVLLMIEALKQRSSDVGIQEDLVSVIRHDLPVDVAVEKLLAPFVSKGLIDVDVKDFALIAPPGSSGFMAAARGKGLHGAKEAAKKALEESDHMLLGDATTVNLMAHIIGNAESFSIGDFTDVGQVVEDCAGENSTIICSSNTSGELAIGEYEVIVTVVVS